MRDEQCSMDDSMERSKSTGQKMVLNQFSRRRFKRREGTGRATTDRAINFDKLLLSGKKPAPPSSSSLFKNISTTLKENVNPGSKIAQNVDDFWAAEYQKRISAVARRKLTGSKESTQEINQQPVNQQRRDRHARSRRGGGKRTLSGKPKLDVYIDAELIADWDKENLEEEEEQPCTIANSEAVLSAQETVLRASFPIVDTIHTQVEANPVDGEPQEQMTHQEESRRGNDQAKSCSSLDDMDLCSGGSPDSLMQNNILNPHDCTPNLSSLVEMDWNTSSPPRIPLHNVLNSYDSLGAVNTLDAETKTHTPRDRVRPDRSQADCLGAEPQGYMSSLPMDCNLDKNCAKHDDTPLRNTTSQRKRLPVTSPTPPADPYAAYMSRRQLLSQMRESGQRKLAFASSPSSSSLDIGDDIGENCQIEDIPDFEVDWDRISYNDDPKYGVVSERDDEAANMRSPVTNSCSGLALQNDGSEADKETKVERYVCDAIQSQESCSMHVRTSNVKSGSRQKSGSNVRRDSLKGKSGVSPGGDGPRTSTVKTTQGEKAGPSTAATALVYEDKGAKTPEVVKPQVSDFKSDNTHQAEKMTLSGAKALPFEGLSEDTPRVDEPPLSPCKSVKTMQVEKPRLSSAAKALRFEGADVDSPGVCASPVSAVKNKQGEKSRPSGAAKALNFEDVAVGATDDSGKAQLLMEEPQEATELEVTLQANTTQPCSNLETQADSITSEKLQSEAHKRGENTRKPRRIKAQDKRSSLEGSENGSIWTNGQRRSQRRRVKPLAWWRGEKLLYGRVNDTLTTVIGIKQSLPGQSFVVESFVPAKYNELVRFAAI